MFWQTCKISCKKVRVPVLLPGSGNHPQWNRLLQIEPTTTFDSADHLHLPARRWITAVLPIHLRIISSSHCFSGLATYRGKTDLSPRWSGGGSTNFTTSPASKWTWCFETWQQYNWLLKVYVLQMRNVHVSTCPGGMQVPAYTGHVRTRWHLCHRICEWQDPLTCAIAIKHSSLASLIPFQNGVSYWTLF